MLLELGIALDLCTSFSLLGNLDNPYSNVFPFSATAHFRSQPPVVHLTA